MLFFIDDKSEWSEVLCPYVAVWLIQALLSTFIIPRTMWSPLKSSEGVVSAQWDLTMILDL